VDQSEEKAVSVGDLVREIAGHDTGALRVEGSGLIGDGDEVNDVPRRWSSGALLRMIEHGDRGRAGIEDHMVAADDTDLRSVAVEEGEGNGSGVHASLDEVTRDKEPFAVPGEARSRRPHELDGLLVFHDDPDRLERLLCFGHDLLDLIARENLRARQRRRFP